MKTRNILLLTLLCSACEPGDTLSRLRPHLSGPRFAVVLSDYSSTAIALLDPDGAVLDPAWVHSGSALPGLVAALSGDVVLSNDSQPGTLTLIDRFRTDVITTFDFAEGTVIGQLRTHEPESGYSSNPQDAVFYGQSSGWISRYERSGHGETGSDLVRFEPGTMRLAADRIALSPLEETRRLPSIEQPFHIRARPSELLRLTDDRILVSADRIDTTFRVAGEGRAAVVHPTSGLVQVVELPGLRNCGLLSPIPDVEPSPALMLVGCRGFRNPGESGTAATSSGFVLLADDGASVVHTGVWPARDAAISAVLGLSATHALVLTFGGESGEAPDRAFLVNLPASEWTEVHRSRNAFELGKPAVDPDSGILIIPDVGAGLVRFQWDGAGLEPRETVEVAGPPGLAPRSVYRVRATDTAPRQ